MQSRARPDHVRDHRRHHPLHLFPQSRDALSLPRMVELALEECGPEHRFCFIQRPVNMKMVKAFVDKPASVLQAASRLGIAAIASATLSQTLLLEHMKPVAELLPGLTNGQRAIQSTRSTPAIAAALVGMGRREHLLENLGVAHVALVTHEQYLRLYQ